MNKNLKKMTVSTLALTAAITCVNLTATTVYAAECSSTRSRLTSVENIISGAIDSISGTTDSTGNNAQGGTVENGTKIFDGVDSDVTTNDNVNTDIDIPIDVSGNTHKEYNDSTVTENTEYSYSYNNNRQNNKAYTDDKDKSYSYSTDRSKSYTNASNNYYTYSSTYYTSSEGGSNSTNNSNSSATSNNTTSAEKKAGKTTTNNSSKNNSNTNNSEYGDNYYTIADENTPLAGDSNRYFVGGTDYLSNDWEEVGYVAPTCDEDGYTNYYNASTGELFTAIEKSKGHDYVTEVTEGGLFSNGSSITYCKSCGDVICQNEVKNNNKTLAGFLGAVASFCGAAFIKKH